MSDKKVYRPFIRFLAGLVAPLMLVVGIAFGREAFASSQELMEQLGIVVEAGSMVVFAILFGRYACTGS